MRYVVTGHLREPCTLSSAEYITLAVREWEMVLGWLASGTALAYGRLVAPDGGALLIEAGSEAAAWALARSLPFAPYVDLRVRRSDGAPPGGRGAERILAELWSAGQDASHTVHELAHLAAPDSSGGPATPRRAALK